MLELTTQSTERGSLAFKIYENKDLFGKNFLIIKKILDIFFIASCAENTYLIKERHLYIHTPCILSLK